MRVEISDRPGDAQRFDELLVATGRIPALAGIGAESVGMDPEAPVDTDPVGTVTGVAGDWLYAVGDVAGGSPLTHVGQQEGRVCGAAIAARAEGRSPEAPPAGTAVTAQVLFTDPQVAAVGDTAAQARDEGRAVRVVDADLGAVAGAGLHRDGYRGQARLVVDTADDTVRGATFVGPDVAEMVHAATIAVRSTTRSCRAWCCAPRSRRFPPWPRCGTNCSPSDREAPGTVGAVSGPTGPVEAARRNARG